MNVLRLSGAFAVLISACYLTGCQPSAPMNPPKAEEHARDHEHDHAEAPKSFADAVAKLEEARDEIREHFEKKEMKEVDEHVHEFGETLEHVTTLAKKEGHEAVDAIQETEKQLFELVGKVDDKLHGKAGAEYSEVSKDIDAALDTLKKYVKK
jgi:hypothetical protein